MNLVFVKASLSCCVLWPICCRKSQNEHQNGYKCDDKCHYYLDHTGSVLFQSNYSNRINRWPENNPQEVVLCLKHKQCRSVIFWWKNAKKSQFFPTVDWTGLEYFAQENETWGRNCFFFILFFFVSFCFISFHFVSFYFV